VALHLKPLAISELLTSIYAIRVFGLREFKALPGLVTESLNRYRLGFESLE
jgi:hypothetical protein